MSSPLPTTTDVLWITTDQMREVDRVTVEDLGVSLLQMMENAGRALAHLARRRFLGGDPVGADVLVLTGTGGNGGGAMACARRLHGWGASVRVAALETDEAALRSAPSHQLRALRRLRIPVEGMEALSGITPPELVVDGILGYGVSGDPREPARSAIRWANGSGIDILALDTPSGLDTTTGHAHDPTIRATATMTLALPKVGLRSESSRSFVGELYLADIGVPSEAYRSLGLEVGPLFAPGDILMLG